MYYVSDELFDQFKTRANKFVESKKGKGDSNFKRTIRLLNELPFLATVYSIEGIPLNRGDRPVVVGDGSKTQISFVLKYHLHSVRFLDYLNRHSGDFNLMLFSDQSRFKDVLHLDYVGWAIQQTIHFESEQKPQLKKLRKLIQQSKQSFLSGN